MTTPARVLSTIIRAGQSLSEPLDTGNSTPTMLYVPAEFDGREARVPVVSFQVSADGARFTALHGAHGMEIVREVVPGTAVPIDTQFASAILWVKIRAGTRAVPVIQDEDRVIALT